MRLRDILLALFLGVLIIVLYALITLYVVLPAYASERVTVRVDPAIVAVGGNTWVTCHVPRHADNRAIMIAIPQHRAHSEEIRGVRAPSMFRMLMQEIPCLPSVEAWCVLETRTERVVARRSLIVIGCEGL